MKLGNLLGFRGFTVAVMLLWMTGWGLADEAATGTGPTTAYLAAYFWEKKGSDGKEDSKLYYAVARDGFRFADAVNKLKPVLAATLGDKITRDPMILRDPDGKSFHLIATSSWKGRFLILFDSSDLVHWTNERVVTVAPENADMTWAPELRWDPETKQYFAYWTSSTDHKWSTAAIWYATSSDLKTFSAPKVLMREPKDGCLDADVLYAQGKWHMVYRYTGIWMRTADHAFGPYENPVKILDLDVEGPFLFPINGTSDQWGLVFDYFGGNQGRWGLATSSDFINWNLVTRKDWPYYTPDVFVPPGVRHGSVLPITDNEADTILQAFGSTKFDDRRPQ
jgi:sucrose-6-phosphate hydrolase SacC (GH32 family)